MKKIVLIASLFVLALSANAETFNVTSQIAPDGESYGSCYFVLGPSSGSYQPNATVQINGFVQGDGGGASSQTKCDAVLTSTAATIVNGPGLRTIVWTNNGSANGTAGATSGNFQVVLTAGGSPGPVQQQTGYVGYTIAAATVHIFFTSALNEIKNIFASIFGTQTTYAQTASTTQTSGAQAIAIANVNLTDATLTKENNDYTLSFNLLTKDANQVDVSYGYNLVDSKGATVYSYTFPAVVSLLQDKMVAVKEKLVLPRGLDGTYKIYAKALTGKGVPLGVGIAGEVTLQGEEVPKITSCTLDKKMYKKDESAKLSCTAEGKNVNGYSLAARIFYGSNPREVSMVTLPIVKGKATSTLSLGGNAGRYTMQAMLTVNGSPVGTPYQVPFVLEGVSASIGNIILDKDSYKEGEVAHATVALTLVGIQKDDVSISAMMSGTDGECSALARQGLSTETVGTISLIASKDCKNPRVDIQVLDNNNTVLASSSLAVQTVERPFTLSLTWILTILVLLGVIFMVVAHITKQHMTRVAESIVTATPEAPAV
jgi:hypothetical protein